MEGESTECVLNLSDTINYLWEGADFRIQISYDPNGNTDNYDTQALIPLMDQQIFKYSAVQSIIDDKYNQPLIDDCGRITLQGRAFNVISISGIYLASQVTSFQLPVKGIYLIQTGCTVHKIVF